MKVFWHPRFWECSWIFFGKCLFQECQYSAKISNLIVFSISKNIVFSIYSELFSESKLNAGICQNVIFLLHTKLI